MKLSMEELVEFLQETLAKDFFFEDDFVIEQLQVSMSELKRAKLDLPEPVAIPNSAETRMSNSRQKMKVFDGSDGKRGSNASQYDNVPGNENENGASVEEAPERTHPHSPRKHTEPSSSPSKVPNKFAFKVQPPSHAFLSQEASKQGQCARNCGHCLAGN
ncbi:hypothetical protein A6R68_01645, partial [Neotoma lepida]